MVSIIPNNNGSVGWGCRIHHLHHCRPPPNVCLGYDAKPSDGKAPIIPRVWGMWSIPSLLLPPGPLWPGVLAPFRVLSMSQIELFDCVQTNDWY